MVNPKQVEAFKELVADAPIYVRKEKPADPKKESGIILANDHPDTLAAAFRKNSDVRYHWNSVDEWSLYHNKQYQEIPNINDLEGYVRRFILVVKVKKRVRQEDGSFKATTQRPDKKMKTPSYISSVVKWLRDDPAVYLRPGQKSPCSLDKSLDPKYIIPVENGLLDWTKHPYNLHLPTHKYYTLQYLPYNWEGDHESEMWTNFMLDSTGMDEKMHDLLQQWAGYCLMKHNQTEQRFMVVYGEAMTGKSVYADVLTHLIGKANIATVPLQKFDDPHMVTQTYGKMLNITDESETTLEESIESNLKHYTGGTMYTFKKMYKPPFSAYPTAKIMIITNHLPAFKDTSDGVWRRLLIVPFDYVVPRGKEIKGLANKIIATEMPGVLAWALKGARKLEKYGFIIPEKCTQQIAEYRREAVAEIAFLDENFEECEPDDIHGRVGCCAFREAYQDWCKEQGIKSKGMRKLSKTMKKLFPLYSRKRGREGIDLGYFYYGIRVQKDSIYFKA